MVVAMTVACTSHSNNSVISKEPMRMSTAAEGEQGSERTPDTQMPAENGTTPAATPAIALEVPIKGVSIRQIDRTIDSVTFEVTASGDFPPDGINLVDQRASDTPQRLFRKRVDEYGQDELVSDEPITPVIGRYRISSATFPWSFKIKIPMPGIYRLVGLEKVTFGNALFPVSIQLSPENFGLLPLGKEPLSIGAGGRVFQTKESCGKKKVLRFRSTAGAWQITFDGSTARPYTYDASFPVGVAVVLSHGAGSEGRSDEYRLSKGYINFTLADPDAAEFRKNISQFYAYSWNTRNGPMLAATIYGNTLGACIDSGTPILESGHSYSGLMALTNNVMSPTAYQHSLGIIARGSPLGGTQHEVPQMMQAVLSREPHAKLLYAYYLWQRKDYNTIEALPNTPVTDMLAGTPSSPRNESARSMAFNGMGTGIPEATYSWFSRYDERVPYLTRQLSPRHRFQMPCPALGNVQTGSPPFEEGCFYNFSEGMLSYADKILSQRTDTLRQPIDIIAGYYSGANIAKRREAFLARLDGMEAILVILGSLIQSEKEKIEEEALPLMNSLLGKSPSVVGGTPNENGINDGLATAAEVCALLDGESIVEKGSTFQSFKINVAAFRKRLRAFVRRAELLEEVDHAMLAIGDPEHRVFRLNNEMGMERMKPLRDEESGMVLGDGDRETIRSMLDDGAEAGCDPSVQGPCIPWKGVTVKSYTQDPDKRNERNRVRVVVGHASPWISFGIVTLDFVRRLGVWYLLVPTSPTQPS